MLKGTQLQNPTYHMHSYVHSSTIHNSQDMEATSMSINRWIDKGNVAYIYNGILLSNKKEWNNAICSNVDLEIIILSKVSQKEKDK